MDFYASIDEVVESVRNPPQYKKCRLLIGAGCSVKAGIPLASKIIEVIRDKYPNTYNRVRDKTSYPECMSVLGHGHRRDLIRGFIEKSKINWAHMAIAQLMKNEIIDRVYTVNFDPLVIKACAMVGLFPAVYDFAASQAFKPKEVHDLAVFYLHGQYTGFKLLNTNEECISHFEQIKPVFHDASSHPWIVVGYSGFNDPVFDHIAAIPNFDYKLFWVGHDQKEPDDHVKDGLLTKSKDAFYVKGYDADGFFVKLAQELGCFPPELTDTPFTFLDNILSQLTTYNTPGQDQEIDITADARKMIRKAIQDIECNKDEVCKDEKADETEIKDKPELDISETSRLSARQLKEINKVINLFLAGEYEKVINYTDLYKQTNDPKLQNIIAWSFTDIGIKLYEISTQNKGEEAEKILKQAIDKYKAAIDIKPDMHDAFNNWGSALSASARLKSGEEAENLFRQAIEKYKAAIDIKPDMHEAFYNWGIALSELAKLKSGEEEKENLLKQAIEKYNAAIDIKPDDDEALFNLGNTLSALAKLKSGEEAEKLFKQAIDKYKAAIDIKPDMHEALNNWGNTLISFYHITQASDRESLLNEAETRFLEAEKIKEGYGAYNLASIASLRGQEQDCLKWLEKSRDRGYLPAVEHINNDRDFERMRDKDWFKAFIASLQAK